jgi:hypothetical protein
MSISKDEEKEIQRSWEVLLPIFLGLHVNKKREKKEKIQKPKNTSAKWVY